MSEDNLHSFDTKSGQNLVIGIRDLLIKTASTSRDFDEARAAREILGALLHAFPEDMLINRDDVIEINKHIPLLFAKVRASVDELAELQKCMNEEECDFTEIYECAADPKKCRPEDDEDDEDEDEDSYDGDADDDDDDDDD